jgi:hypothetical protein
MGVPHDEHRGFPLREWPTKIATSQNNYIRNFFLIFISIAILEMKIWIYSFELNSLIYHLQTLWWPCQAMWSCMELNILLQNIQDGHHVVCKQKYSFHEILENKIFKVPTKSIYEYCCNARPFIRILWFSVTRMTYKNCHEPK